MITVYVWTPNGYISPDKIYQGNMYDNLEEIGNFNLYSLFGHVSIHVGLDDGREEYLSFCPDTRNDKDIKIALSSLKGSLPPKFMEDLEADKKLMGYLPDLYQEIDFLDEYKIYEEIINFKRSPEKYNLYVRNCSTIATAILSYGIQKNKMSDLMAYAKKAGEIMFITYVISQARQSDFYAQQVLAKRYLTSSNILFSAFEAIGARTPKTVLEYIVSLEKIALAK